jgi:type IV secretory pathway TraG/TraD family ATPase VirD4
MAHHHHQSTQATDASAPQADLATGTTAAPASLPPAVGSLGLALAGGWVVFVLLILIAFNTALKRRNWRVTSVSKAFGQMWGWLVLFLFFIAPFGLGLAVPLGMQGARLLAPLHLPPVVSVGLSVIVAGVLLAGLAGQIGAAIFMHKNRPRTSEPHRGAHVVSGAQWQKNTADWRDKAAKTGAATPVRFAGCGISFADETKHFLAMGTTGSGKSAALRRLLADAGARGDRAIIADPDGGFVARFYDPARGDLILNPLDARSVRWSPIAECASPYQADELARAIIPDTGGNDSQWTNYARTLLAAILRQGKAAGLTDAGEVHQLMVSAPVDELRVLLGGTAAAPFLAEGSEKMFAGTRSTAADAVRGLEYISDGPPGEPFSVSEWARSGGPGWLFLPYQADQIAALRGLIAAWMRLAIFATMSRGEGDSRTWFVVDELDALGKIEGLADALQRLRKFGGRCALGFQSIGPLASIYGDGIAAALVENTGTKLILRCSASEGGGTARFASDVIGQRDVWRQSTNSGTQTHLQGVNQSQGSSLSLATESAVLASEIEKLADLNGYLRSPSVEYWARVAFMHDGLQQHAAPYVPFPVRPA